MKKAIIQKGKGKRKNQFRFSLIASNGRNLSDREFYTRKAHVTRMLTKNFPEFKIVDLTINQK